MKKKYRVLHVCNVGFGLRALLIPQINYFISNGLIVESACSPDTEVDDLINLGYTVHPINIARKISAVSNFRSIIDLVKLFNKNQYDLVHLHGPIASVLGRVAAKISGVKNIVYTAHGFYFHDDMPKRKYWTYHWIEKVTGWLTDIILTQSREDFENAIKTNLCPSSKISYLGNGIDINRFNRERLDKSDLQDLAIELKLPNREDLITIGITGRITQEKGHGELIESFIELISKYPNIHLIILGGQLSSERDSFQECLKRTVSQNKIENNVTFTGIRKDIDRLLGLVDIFVLPSYREGLPRSMELPVITTDIRGCREAVIHEQTGLIVPPKNVEKLTQALEKLISDPILRRDYGKSGRLRVMEEYDETLVFNRLRSVYQKLGVN
jgi:glycosyltransferase involved in cell wall biosynthesis